ncbi:MAG: hypothetical protein NVSMB64_30410 [Candidatus Velthaea sp.]
MLKRFLAAAAMIALCAGIARADQNPTNPAGPLNAAEKTFVREIQADLMHRFRTAAAAERAGYVRYTNVDDTGAISYANNRWNSTDTRHPSQLWYDVSGNLLGADFSILSNSAMRPHRFGIDPGRWTQFDAHIHYVTRDPKTGMKTYDQATSVEKFKAAGGDPAHPTAAVLVKMGRAKAPRDVATVFLFPSIWDLVVWVKPNPAGPFAEKNPTVTPKKT